MIVTTKFRAMSYGLMCVLGGYCAGRGWNWWAITYAVLIILIGTSVSDREGRTL